MPGTVYETYGGTGFERISVRCKSVNFNNRLRQKLHSLKISSSFDSRFESIVCFPLKSIMQSPEGIAIPMQQIIFGNTVSLFIGNSCVWSSTSMFASHDIFRNR